MRAAENLPLTAGDLMSRDVKTLRADLTVREAAVQLTGWGIHGSPVVDDTGRCVGVFSVSDLARWASGRGEHAAQVPRTCPFQQMCREPGGRETILCRLPAGVCPFQRLRELPDGKLAVVCTEPHCVPTDWQMVEVESLPGDAVRDFMTSELVTVGTGTPVPELARVMLEHGVHRLVVLDPQGCPVGIVAVNDLLQVLAHPELSPVSDPR